MSSGCCMDVRWEWQVLGCRLCIVCFLGWHRLVHGRCHGPLGILYALLWQHAQIHGFLRGYRLPDPRNSPVRTARMAFVRFHNFLSHTIILRCTSSPSSLTSPSPGWDVAPERCDSQYVRNGFLYNKMTLPFVWQVGIARRGHMFASRQVFPRHSNVPTSPPPRSPESFRLWH